MTSNDYARLEQLLKRQASELDEKLAQHVTAISESFDHKIGLIAEGHITLHQAIQDLARKTDERFDLVDFKIDAVATDLKAHRNDTEAHGGIYRVKEV